MFRLEKITTAHPGYAFAESLWLGSFPPEERRETAAQRANADGNALFSCLLATDGDGAPVGLFTYWDFGTFAYCEHFATDPGRRNRGLGAQILALALERVGKPLVLEVEMPADGLSRRRVGFYERCGLVLHPEFDYLQPPYRAGGEPLPMRLMTTRDFSAESLAGAAATIHEKVYGHGSH